MGAFVASIAVAVPATSSAPDLRAASGACSSADGVTVVVDFGSAGGIQTRCAPAPVDNGFAALQKAGFAITNVRTQPGFLCQIDAQPTSDCQRVPTGQYWSYWHAPRGGAWTYSTSGASRKPPAGTVEGWSLGAGQAPGVAPPAPAPVPTTSTTRVASPTPVAPPTTTAGGPAPTTRAPAPPAPDPTLAAPTTLSAETGGAPATADASPTTAARTADGVEQTDDDGDDREVAGSPMGRDDPDSGSPIGALVGLGAVGALAAAGAVTARRRRRAEPAGA